MFQRWFIFTQYFIAFYHTQEHSFAHIKNFIEKKIAHYHLNNLANFIYANQITANGASNLKIILQLRLLTTSVAGKKTIQLAYKSPNNQGGRIPKINKA